MENKILIGLLILILSLLMLSGCGEYKCKKGIKEGNACYTEPFTMSKQGISSIGEYEIKDLSKIIGYNEVEHLTPSNCVYETLNVIYLNYFEINDSTLILQPNNDISLEIFNREDKNKTFSYNFSAIVRWKRIIWDVDRGDFCYEELKEVGAELK